MRLGIDFGTTRTVVCSCESGRYPVVSFESTDAFVPWLRTMAVHDTEHWHFGQSAADRLIASERSEEGLRVIRSLKRFLAGLGPDQLVHEAEEESTTALSLATEYLSWVRHSILHRSNLQVPDDEPLEVMISVPANARSRQRYLTMEAFTKAGFVVLGMINEPTAAAIEFAHRNRKVLSARSPKRYVLVYDLGGGTFDTSAVSLEGQRFELLVSEGIGRLGGDDFDQEIFEVAAAALGIEPESLDPASTLLLLEACRDAKEALGPKSRKILIDPPSELGLESVTLELAGIYERCEAPIAQSLQLLDQVVSVLPSLGIDPENGRELGAVYLVGGGIAFPPVARALRARYGRKIQLAPEPHAATAVGLAVAADPDAAVFITEATTRHFGVWREGEGGQEKIFDRILGKDTLPQGDEPLTIERTYRPEHAIGKLRYVECSRLDEAGQPGGDLMPWATLRFPYDPRFKDRADLEDLPIGRGALSTPQLIRETYIYHRDGILEVEIENVDAGYSRKLHLGKMA